MLSFLRVSILKWYMHILYLYMREIAFFLKPMVSERKLNVSLHSTVINAFNNVSLGDCVCILQVAEIY